MLSEWAQRWAISPAALADLQQSVLGLNGAPPDARTDLSEAGVQSRVRVAGSRRGMRLWRNNVGVYHDPDRNVYVRYGLANESKQQNEVVKSADLVGIAPRIIQPQDVGKLIGQFVSFECKHAGWKHRPNDPHEQAQVAWATLILSLGGDARFLTSDTQV